MLIFKRLIHSASRGFPQWVELHYDDMDKLHPPWPLPPAVSGQRPVSRVPAAAAGAEWAGPQEGGPRRMEVGRGKRMVASLSRAFRTAGIVLEWSYQETIVLKNIDSPYHSAEIGNHDCFYNADHVPSLITINLWKSYAHLIS